MRLATLIFALLPATAGATEQVAEQILDAADVEVPGRTAGAAR